MVIETQAGRKDVPEKPQVFPSQYLLCAHFTGHLI